VALPCGSGPRIGTRITGHKPLHGEQDHFRGLLLVRRSTLTQWRMTLARDYLRTGELTLAQIASRTG
jgi:hypothetical protein